MDNEAQQENMRQMYSGLSGLAHRINMWLFSRHIQCERSRMILDIGCGDGALLGCLRFRTSASLIGIDADPIIMSYAIRSGVTYITGDAERMELPRNCDIIILSCVLHHCENPEALLDKARKSLRLGGQLIIREISNTWYLRFLIWTGQHHLWIPILYTHQKNVAELEADYISSWLTKWDSRKAYLKKLGFVWAKSFSWWTFEVLILTKE